MKPHSEGEEEEAEDCEKEKDVEEEKGNDDDNDEKCMFYKHRVMITRRKGELYKYLHEFIYVEF
jgi:hypothetical protein